MTKAKQVFLKSYVMENGIDCGVLILCLIMRCYYNMISDIVYLVVMEQLSTL